MFVSLAVLALALFGCSEARLKEKEDGTAIAKDGTEYVLSGFDEWLESFGELEHILPEEWLKKLGI